PYSAPDSFRKRFDSTIAADDLFRLISHKRYPWASVATDRLQQAMNSYDAALAWQDDELGRLFAAVPDNTLVVVFSDHGEGLKEHGWFQHGMSLYEEELHVALIMRCKGLLPEDVVVQDA